MHDHSDFFEFMLASSLGPGHAARERAGIACNGPLGFHKPGAFAKRPLRCLSCNKLIFMADDTGQWTAMTG